MTREEKLLLLKDLCGRLPYHLGIRIYNDNWEGCRIGEFDNIMGFHHIEAFLCDRIEILPYLRPMSSMTDEEKKEFDKVLKSCNDKVFACPEKERRYKFFDAEQEDFMNAHYFDYRIVPSTGKTLIESGLALEAPEGIYKQIT